MRNDIIRKMDYRAFEYRTNPVSSTHHDIIKKVHTVIEEYFKNRPECQVDRKAYSSNSNNRYYSIKFATLDDSKMFELVFAEHIDTQGVKYD